MIRKYQNEREKIIQEVYYASNRKVKKEDLDRIKENLYGKENFKYLECECKREEIPYYLERVKGNNMQKVARWRVGNECNKNKRWLNEKGRICRICNEEEESLSHIVNDCIFKGKGITEEDILCVDRINIGLINMIDKEREENNRMCE